MKKLRWEAQVTVKKGHLNQGEVLEVELDAKSYCSKRGTARVFLEGVEAEVSDVKPWEVIASLCRLVGAGAEAKHSAVYSKSRLQISTEISWSLTHGKRFPRTVANALATISLRTEESINELLPRESFKSRVKKIADSETLEETETKNESQRKRRSNGELVGSPGEDVELDLDYFRLPSIYALWHSISTGEVIQNPNESATNSLEDFACDKQRLELTIEPRPDARQNAARRLALEEGIMGRELEGEAGCSTRSKLLCIPTPALFTICAFLNAYELPLFRQTCKYINYSCGTVVPCLKVDLFSHQKQALRWMDRQETGFGHVRGYDTQKLKLISKLSSNPQRVPLLESLCAPGTSLEIDLDTMHVLQEQSPANGSVDDRPLRGGLLCDEPGLGKTISILAFVLHAASNRKFSGRGTKGIKREDALGAECLKTLDFQFANMSQNGKKMILQEIYKDLVTNCGTRNIVFKGLPDFVLSGLLLSLGAISGNMDESTKNSELRFSQWKQSVDDLFQTSFLWFPQPFPDTVEMAWKKGISSVINVLNTSVRRIQDRFEKKGTRSSSVRQVKQKIQEEETTGLFQSNCTLVVVPFELLNHWRTQVALHVDCSYFGKSSEDLFYFDGGTGSQGIPPPKKLAKYLMVFTSTARLSSEEGTRAHMSSFRRVHWRRVIVDEGHSLGSCMQTQYGNFLLRIICDCRWVMSGTPAKETSLRAGLRSFFGLMRFLKHDIYGFVEKGGLDKWNALMARPFLRREPIAVVRFVSLLANCMLRHTKIDVAELPPLMIRKVPLNLNDLERNTYNALVLYGKGNILLTGLGTKGFEHSLLNPANNKLAFNLLKNIRLSCSGGGLTRANLTNANFIETREMLSEVHNASEAEIRNANEFMARVVTGQLSQCQTLSCKRMAPLLFLTPCVHYMCVQCFERFCVKTQDFKCLCCGKYFDPDEFAALQPGFELEWVKENEGLEVLTNPPPHFSIAAEYQREHYLSVNGGSALSFLEPVSVSFKHSKDMASKVEYIVSKLSQLRRDRKKCQDLKQPPLKCIVYSQFREVLNMLGTEFIQRFGSQAVAEFWGGKKDLELVKYTHNHAEYWQCHECNFENDASFTKCECYKITISVQRRVNNGVQGSTYFVAATSIIGWFPGKEYRVGERVTLNRNAVDVPDLDLLGEVLEIRVTKSERCIGKASKSTWHTSENVDCFILLLSKKGSTGLDLSMTTNIFLLDKIWDTGQENQVISRAWRLGARAPEIQVDQLYSVGTVEELMYDYSKFMSERPEFDDEGSLQVSTTEKTKPHQSKKNKGKPEKARRNVGRFSKLHFILSRMGTIEDPALNRVLGDGEASLQDPLQEGTAAESNVHKETKKKRLKKKVRFAND